MWQMHNCLIFDDEYVLASLVPGEVIWGYGLSVDQLFSEIWYI